MTIAVDWNVNLIPNKQRSLNEATCRARFHSATRLYLEGKAKVISVHLIVLLFFDQYCAGVSNK